MEEWKNCFENYEISSFGNCRKLNNNGEYKEIKGSIISCGYRYFQVQREGKRINKLFHQLVAKAFIYDNNLHEGLIVDHIDRNKLNNRVENLRYVTHQDNIRNSTHYYEDIESEGKERVRILRNICYNKNREKYKCEVCPLLTTVKGTFPDKRAYDVHMISRRHLARVRIYEEMENNNIDRNRLEYTRLKYHQHDYNRGRRQDPPLINMNTT